MSKVSSAFSELAGLLGDIVQVSARNHAVKAAAVALNADVDDSRDVQRARNALQRLIAGSQVDHFVREDFSIGDFYLLGEQRSR